MTFAWSVLGGNIIMLLLLGYVGPPLLVFFLGAAATWASVSAISITLTKWQATHG